MNGNDYIEIIEERMQDIEEDFLMQFDKDFLIYFEIPLAEIKKDYNFDVFANKWVNEYLQNNRGK